MNTAVALDVRSLSVKAGERYLIRDISLRVAERETVAILGWSGAGKTTLLHAIAGLLAPQLRVTGPIVHADRDLSGTPAYLRTIPLVLQELGLFQHLTALENVMEPLVVGGMSRRNAAQRAMAELTELGLTSDLHNRRPEKLSGGEAQRVALGRALVREPDLVLLDEPTSALDPVSARRLADLLGRLRTRQPVAAVVCTHDRTFATRIAQRLVILHAGSIIQEGSVDELHSQPRTSAVSDMLGLPNVLPARLARHDVVDVAGMGSLRLAANERGADDAVGRLVVHPHRVRLLRCGQAQGRHVVGRFVGPVWLAGQRVAQVLVNNDVKLVCPLTDVDCCPSGSTVDVALPTGALWYFSRL